MAYTYQNLLTDLMQRAARLDNAAGITLLQAADSVKSFIGKKLLAMRSDLLAGNNLSLNIPANGYVDTLPEGFIALSEKPWTQDVYTDWMLVTVKSYTTDALVVTVQDSNGSDTIDDWYIATVPTPGITGFSQRIDASETSNTIGSAGDELTFTVSTGMSYTAGQSLYIYTTSIPGQTIPTSPFPYYSNNILQPTYLNEDDSLTHDLNWWGWYGMYGWEWEPPAKRPKWYRIVGMSFYVRPMPVYAINIYGVYYGLPSALTKSSTIPWNGLFDEIFREATIRMLQKGSLLIESDPDMMMFMNTHFQSVMNARMHILPKTRTWRGNFM